MKHYVALGRVQLSTEYRIDLPIAEVFQLPSKTVL